MSSLQEAFATVSDKNGRVAFKDANKPEMRSILPESVKGVDDGMIVTTFGYRDPKTSRVDAQSFRH